MTQNNRIRFNEKNASTNFNYALHRARLQNKRVRDARYTAARAKVMCVVLAVAFAASAITAVIVSTIKVNESRAAAAKNTAAITAQLKEAPKTSPRYLTGDIEQPETQAPQSK